MIEKYLIEMCNKYNIKAFILSEIDNEINVMFTDDIVEIIIKFKYNNAKDTLYIYNKPFWVEDLNYVKFKNNKSIEE